MTKFNEVRLRDIPCGEKHMTRSLHSVRGWVICVRCGATTKDSPFLGICPRSVHHEARYLDEMITEQAVFDAAREVEGDFRLDQILKEADGLDKTLDVENRAGGAKVALDYFADNPITPLVTYGAGSNLPDLSKREPPS